MAEIHTLSIDIETFSDVDLSKCGVYKYAESNAFEILLFGYAVNSGSVSVVDLASGEEIEARVLSYLAHETWRSRVFAEGKDIYCASASQMFHVPVEKHGINSHLRQKGKIAELALGYGGSVGALTSMGALEMGLSEDELMPLVDAWRSSNPNIVQFWWDVDNAVKTTVKQRILIAVNGIRFRY